MEKLDIKKDFKFIKWKETLQITTIRAVIAGIIWFVFFVISTLSEGAPVDILGVLMMLFAFPIGFFIFFIPVGLICGFLSSKGVPLVGLLAIMCSLAIVVADPIVYAIHKSKPMLIPIEKYGFFNFVVLICVIDEEKRQAAFASA